MKTLNFLFLICLVSNLFQGCKSGSVNDPKEEPFPEFYEVGHRGARGLMPENTIPSMKKAIDEGANFLEVDVQISKDHEVVIYHDHYINRNFTLLPDGSEIPEEDSHKYLIHNMDYNNIREFKIGIKTPSGFPKQEKINTQIPLLGELIDSIEIYTAKKNLPPINYLIEIKANPEKDGEYQPDPETYVHLIMKVLEKRSIGSRFYLQSFDIRQLQEIRKNYPEVVVGFLTGNKNKTFEENIEALGFYPQVYSPSFNLATEKLIKTVHKHGLKLVPWTVNSKEDMTRLIGMGVDGIITDYPNFLREILHK